MRKLLASAALALSLSAPMVAMPPAAAAQVQSGLVNVSVEDNEIVKNVNVGVAANAIVQACDLVDASNVSVIVGLLSAVASGQDSDNTATFPCNANQEDAVITQSAGPGGGRGGHP